mmetsp:Transcript_40090/g.100338  ORF Transcript_40090/g.100338 Transcript_40090/m.100338 type:complete len:213 (-) Transcript_40090:170-808(-)
MGHVQIALLEQSVYDSWGESADEVVQLLVGDDPPVDQRQRHVVHEATPTLVVPHRKQTTILHRLLRSVDQKEGRTDFLCSNDTRMELPNHRTAVDGAEYSQSMGDRQLLILQDGVDDLHIAVLAQLEEDLLWLHLTQILGRILCACRSLHPLVHETVQVHPRPVHIHSDHMVISRPRPQELTRRSGRLLGLQITTVPHVCWCVRHCRGAAKG